MKAVMAVAVVVVAVSAIGASAASATQSEPYFVAVKGTLPMKAAATIVAQHSHLEFWQRGVYISCEKGSDSGEILNRTVSGQSIGGLQKGTVTFERCALVGAGECNINGKEPGEGVITLTGVAAELGYAPGHANKENVLVHLTSENAEGIFTTVTLTGAGCSLKNEKYRVREGAIGSIPSIDIEKPLTEVSLEFAVIGEGWQEFKKIENPGVGTFAEGELRWGGFLGLAGIRSSGLLKLTEAGNEVEIKL